MPTVKKSRSNGINQELVIEALLVCSTIKEVYLSLGLPKRTLTRMMANPDFKAKLNTARTEMLSQAVVKLNSNVGLAVQVLVDLMEDEKSGGQTRLLAAKTLLEYSVKLDSHFNMTERIEALEARIIGG